MPDDPTPQNQNPQPPAPSAPPVPPANQPPAPTEPKNEQLGEAGLRALQAERDARAEFERKYQEEKKAREALEREKLSEAEKLQRDAEEGRALAATAKTQLQEANLLIALTGKGLLGPTAMAASRLIEGVQYDDQGRPTNLDDRLAAAKATYGEQMFTGATPPAPPAPGAPAPMAPAYAPPVVHQGVRQPMTEAEENALFEQYMQQNFPQTAAPAAN